MGIIFQVATKNKSEIIKILAEILKNAESKGVQIYEEENNNSICES
jgi:hypothetical protein